MTDDERQFCQLNYRLDMLQGEVERLNHAVGTIHQAVRDINDRGFPASTFPAPSSPVPEESRPADGERRVRLERGHLVRFAVRGNIAEGLYMVAASSYLVFPEGEPHWAAVAKAVKRGVLLPTSLQAKTIELAEADNDGRHSPVPEESRPADGKRRVRLERGQRVQFTKAGEDTGHLHVATRSDYLNLPHGAEYRAIMRAVDTELLVPAYPGTHYIELNENGADNE